jgi:sugar lactone lactonase YvrE
MKARALETATRGALAVAAMVAAGCGTGTITIVSPTNGGFSDPSGNVTAQVSIGGGACGTFQATLDGVDVTPQFSPLPPPAASTQGSFHVNPGEHLLKVRSGAGSPCGTVTARATFSFAGVGAIYVTDGSFPQTPSDRIVRFTDMTGANWTTFGSSGNGTNQFSFPRGLFVYSIEEIFVVDQSNHRLVQVKGIAGSLFTPFGTQGFGTNEFADPLGISLDAGMRIHVSDGARNRVVRIDDITGGAWTELGSTGNGVNQFSQPAGITVGANGKIYVVDSGNDRIVRMNDMTGAGWITFGLPGSGTGQFGLATWIALDASGRIYVADTGNCRIARFDDMTGANWVTQGIQGTGALQFQCQSSQLGGIFVDSAGRILVADTGNARIVRMEDMTGAGWTTLGSFGSGTNQFVSPNSVFVKPPSLVVAP